MNKPGRARPRPPRPVWATQVGVVALGLLVSGCGGASGDGSPAADTTTVHVRLTPDGCKPDPARVDAGAVTFTVANAGATVVSEAELRSGSTILGEKENLTPGLSGDFSLKLEPGSYTVYCPNAAHEEWTLRVTGSAATSTFSPAVRSELRQATEGYHDYVVAQVRRLVAATDRFTDAVTSGNVARAKRLYAPARSHYEQVEPVAESFGSLDPGIDARINDVSDTSAWTGFHRIERALWQDGSVSGMAGYAHRLTEDIAQLQRRVAAADYQPPQLANGATELLNEVASSKITGEEDRYSHTDLADLRANILGGRKAFELLEPALQDIDADLARTVSKRYEEVLAALDPYRGSYAGTEYVNYSTVTQHQRRLLTQKVDALAEPLSNVAATVTG